MTLSEPRISKGLGLPDEDDILAVVWLHSGGKSQIRRIAQMGDPEIQNQFVLQWAAELREIAGKLEREAKDGKIPSGQGGEEGN